MTVLDRKLITRMVNPQPGGNGGGGGSVPSSQAVNWTDIDGKPTTLAGYGITDAKWADQTQTSDRRNLTIGSVTQQVITAHQSLSGYATEYWVGQQGYATQSWVGQQGYLTSSALNGYATQTWVGQQGFATQTWVGNNYLPLTGGTMTGNLEIRRANSDDSHRSQIYVITPNDYPCDVVLGANNTQCWSWSARDSASAHSLLLWNFRTQESAMWVNGNTNNVGIGTQSPSYKLHVVGKIYCTGGFAFLSDIRKKNVVGFCNGFSVKDIANAPLIQYTLKGDLDDGRRHIGSVAQYWQKVLPDTVNEIDDTLSMDQESILMASVITLARKVMSLENQIIQLKVKGYGKQ